jgi:N-acetylglutamate synthase/N-acetylornithine aminotransferase
VNIILLASNTNKSKEMNDLLQKEKELHKEIRADYKKISQKINDDFENARKLKSQK